MFGMVMHILFLCDVSNCRYWDTKKISYFICYIMLCFGARIS